jgi:hypothetical protein
VVHGLVDHAHTAFTDFLDDFVLGDALSDHSRANFSEDVPLVAVRSGHKRRGESLGGFAC